MALFLENDLAQGKSTHHSGQGGETMDKKKIWSITLEYAMLTLATLVMVAGIYVFKFPNHFSFGGVTGIAIILSGLFDISASSITFIINMALLLVGFLFLGRGFGIKTVYVSVLMSGALSLLEYFFPMSAPLTNEPVLELIFAIVLPSFGSAILLQAIVNQVNNNVDTMILGAYINDKSIITMYSSALAVYSIYNSLISVISNFFLPKATKLVMQNASGTELTDLVIKPGRFQAMIAVGCIFGFSLFGRNFITIWIGEKYLDAYLVTLILMIPVTIPLVENAVISILDASLKRIYRSTVLVIMAVFNVVISVLLISRFGFWGAAAGTAISLIVGHGFLMNIYYAKTFKIEIGRMFISIFKGILPAGLLASLLCLPLSVYLSDTILYFAVKCILFVALYFLFLILFGMNTEEKEMIQIETKKLFSVIKKK